MVNKFTKDMYPLCVWLCVGGRACSYDGVIGSMSQVTATYDSLGNIIRQMD